jgi:hypothetical protein
VGTVLSLLVGVGGYVFALLAGVPTWGLICVAGGFVAALSRSRLDWLMLRSLGLLPKGVSILPHYTLENQERLPLDLHLGIPQRGYVEAGQGTSQVRLTIQTEGCFSPLPDADSDLEVFAGFVRLARPKKALLNESNECPVRWNNAIPIRATVAPGAHGDATLRAGLGKELRFAWAPRSTVDEERPWRPPFVARPYIDASRRNSRCWGLEFVLTDVDIDRVILKTLIMDVPPEVKSVEWSDGVYEREAQRVRWTGLVITSANPGRVLVEFSRPVYEAAIISGRYEVEIPDVSISGMSFDEAGIWSVTGRGVDPKCLTVKQMSNIDGTFEAATRLQPTREEVIARRGASFPGAALSDALAHRILVALSARNVDAKDVVESKRRPGDAKASGFDARHWEILGRFHVGNRPYDVHLLLTAGETTHDRKNPPEPIASVEIVVRTLAEWAFVREERQGVDAVCFDLMSLVEAELKG